jgi:hypothetical protein
MKRVSLIAVFLMLLIMGNAQTQLLKISANKRYFVTADRKPFFWLGDTGWLLFVKLNREDAIQYLDARKEQGYNVIQVMVLHEIRQAKNVYGDSALNNLDISLPRVTPGNDPNDAEQYDYWDHVEFIVDEAAKRGLYMALVPVWGSNVKAGFVTVPKAEAYATFLAERFKDKKNIIWLNGGDTRGNEALPQWNALGSTLHEKDPHHLMTFHPFGRRSSSEWFHNEPWVDFNMFQSGHRDYAQDTSVKDPHHYGEDNWRYVVKDYALQPVKPVLDGEPSYENIPHGLHDSLEARWTAADLRRYAYWSVLAGGAGFTYGENAIMQFHTKGDKDANFGVNDNWKNTLYAPGALQMKYLKALILSKPFFERKPAQEILAHNDGTKYDYLVASKGNDYAFIYTYTGNNFTIDAEKLGFRLKKAKWYNPRDGKTTSIKDFGNEATVMFDPPGEPSDGNDWVLILEN